MAVYRTYPSNAGFQFHWMDSWQDILGTTIEKGYYFQFHWMDSPEERARKAEEIETFNFIGWIPDASDAVKSTTRKLRLSISLDGFKPDYRLGIVGGNWLSISLDGFSDPQPHPPQHVKVPFNFIGWIQAWCGVLP